MNNHTISNEHLSIGLVDEIINQHKQLVLSDNSRKLVKKSRAYLDEKIKDNPGPIYGINTGFGSLYSKNIPLSDLGTLQANLVMSHACGTGAQIPNEIVQLILLLKIQSLAYGYSGVQVETIERLITYFNNGVFPVVYEYGSLGASGDLAPLAHLSLPLIGLGEVDWKGERHSGDRINHLLGLSPLKLKAKEGLALLNGTQFMAAYGVWCVMHAKRLSKLATIIGSLSLDVFDGRLEPFHPLVHKIRPQKGQAEIARQVSELLHDSELIKRKKSHVQDPYSFRCIPQVHGATLDAINYSEEIITNELNGVTDNPNVFPDEDLIISAGNFHGQPLALTLDFLTIAISEIGSISERRTYQLISGSRGLPNYLVANPGINSGLMIPQYTAASLVSMNKSLCHPASVDSIVSSNGQEDHVSMGANAATKAYKVLNNVYSILALELITASQALEIRHPEKTGSFLESFVSDFKMTVPFIENDRVLHEDISAAEEFVKTVQI
jgi:histidine ammonia-lyase